MGSGGKPSDGLAVRMGFRLCCLSMPFIWEQGALVPPPGDRPGCKGWLPAHTNPLCSAGGGWQLLQLPDLGEGLKSQNPGDLPPALQRAAL